MLQTARYYYSRGLTSFIGAADVALGENNRQQIDQYLGVVESSAEYFKNTPNARQQLEDHYKIRVDFREISAHIRELRHPEPGLGRVRELLSSYMARLNALN